MSSPDRIFKVLSLEALGGSKYNPYLQVFWSKSTEELRSIESLHSFKVMSLLFLMKVMV